MSKIVVLFGAGSSVSSGAPLMHNFIDIGTKLSEENNSGIDYDSFEIVKKARQELQKGSIKSNIDIHNIEDFFTAFELANIFGRLGDLDVNLIKKLPSSMKKFIIQTIEAKILYKLENGFIRPHSAFSAITDFIHHSLDRNIIKNLSDVTLITFNYDLNLEIALHYNNIPFTYSFQNETNKDKLKLLKLHGSINWEKLENNEIIEAIKIKDIMANRQPLKQSKIQIKLSSNIANQFIVPPSWNKLYHFENLQSIWKSACSSLSDCENLIIMGYSFPDSDLLFRYLYAIGTISLTIIKNVIIVNPSDMKDVIDELFGKTVIQRTKFLNKKFEELGNDYYQIAEFSNL